MKKMLLFFLTRLLVVSPVIISFIWHLNNQGWPNDDAAEYMQTAYQQYLVFRDGPLMDGIKSLYQIRGWRPTIFPLLATPFLLLFKGNVLAATGAALVFCFLVCQLYLYAIARRYLDSPAAALAAAFVGSCPAIIFQSSVFFSEMAWLAFFAGFIFHLLESDYFRKSSHAIAAGIFLGFSLLIRPAETFVIASIPLLIIIASALSKKTFQIKSAGRVIIFLIVVMGLLVASVFTEQVNYRFLLVIGGSLVFLQMIIKTDKEKEPGFGGFNLFAVSIAAINLLWWADSMPSLYSWVYNTSFGFIAEVTDVSIRNHGLLVFFKDIFINYLFPSGMILALLCLIVPLSRLKRNFSDIKRLCLLTMITVGSLLPIFLMYAFTGTSDSRRAFAGMGLLLLLMSVVAMQNGSLHRLRYLLISLMVIIQLSASLCIANGKPDFLLHPALIEKGRQGMPRENADRNEAVIYHLLEAGVPPNSSVATYTIALFQARDRIYEPAALNLAALTTGSHLKIVYFWDIGDYFAVLKRLKLNKVSYLLIDVYKDIENKNVHQPSVQFTMSLLNKLNGPYVDPHGLQQIAAFKINGRQQLLFKVLPYRITPAIS